MQEIGRALEHLVLAAASDKGIVARITKAVGALTKNNVAPTSQLNKAMYLNLDMSNKRNVKPTQDTEDKKLTDMSKSKVKFEINLDPEGYCCTHGFRVTKSNRSQTCLAPVAGHQRVATRENIIVCSKAKI